MAERFPQDLLPPPGARSEKDLVRKNTHPSDPRFSRRLLALVLLLTVAISAGGWLYYRTQHAAARSAARESLATIADLKAQDIANWMEERRGDAEVARMSIVTKWMTAIPNIPGSAEAQRAAIDQIEVFRKVYGYAAVVLANERGEVQFKIPADSRLPVSSVAQHIQLALQAPKVLVSDLHPTHPGEPAHLWLSCPVFTQPQSTGVPDAALVLVIDPRTFLYPTVQRWPARSRTAETLLVQNGPGGLEYLNKRRYAADSPPKSGTAGDATPPDLASLAAQSTKGVFEATDYRGVRVIAAVRKVAGTPWLILAKVDEEEILAPLRREAWSVGLITALLLLATALGIGILWRQQKLLYARRELAERRRLQESLTLFRALVDHANDAIEVLDPQTARFLDVNEKASEVLGYTREEYLALTVFEIDPRFAAGGRPMWSAHLEKLQQSGYLVFETEHRRKDGSVFPVEINASYFRLERDYILAVVRDITERMRTDLHIRQLNRVYAVLSGINTLIVRERNPQVLFEAVCRIATEEGKFRMACIRTLNESAQILKPVASSGAVEGLEDALTIDLKNDSHSAGPSGRAFLTGEHQVINDITADPRMEPWRETALRLGYRACASFPLKISGKPAGVFTLHASETDFFDSDELRLLDELAGDIGFALEVHQNELDRQSLEEQFRQSQKMEGIGQLAGGVAHDFNNILGAIIMHAELAEMEDGVSPIVREGLQEIRLAGERAATLTRQLLMFSRRQVMQPRQLDLNEVVTGLAKMLQRIIGEDIRMQLSLHPTPLMAHADAGMIDQILMNLAVNARDAMPGGGRLLIETAAKNVDENLARHQPDASPGPYVWLSVSDTGSGIPPEVLPRIFEPFFTTKDAGKGTGLGLATVFGIVKQHRGWIHVESDPDRGTNFQVFIPASAATAPDTAAAAPKPKPRGGTETILLVEDDVLMRAVTSALLDRHGYRVLEAASGVEALNLWPQHEDEVALLLTDLVMPGGVGGQELASRLAAKHPRLKIIFISGYSADIAGRSIELRDGENFVQKPCSSDHLLETVRRCLDGQKGR